MGTNLKIPCSTLNMGEQRGADCFIQTLLHGTGEGEDFHESRGISRGRHLASGLEPDCKFSSCFYQMGANLSQNNEPCHVQS